jgi:hypothetical protein
MGKAKVRQRVFMRTIDLRCIRKSRQFVQRCNHLFRRTFKQSSAAACKQGVAAEQPGLFRCEICYMTARMSWHIKYV